MNNLLLRNAKITIINTTVNNLKVFIFNLIRIY
jgi:hypothetical protein